MSALIRDLIEDYFGISEKLQKDPLDTIRGIGTGSGAPVGQDHDQYLYHGNQ